MKFSRAEPEQVANFERLAASIEGVERRKMFGYPAGFANGNMAFGLYEDRVMLRLPPAEREELLARGWRFFEVMPGRAMREFVTLPAEIATDAGQAQQWLQRAADYTTCLPAKTAKTGRGRGTS